MQTLVVYESLFGNTHAIAEAIADGLRPRTVCDRAVRSESCRSGTRVLTSSPGPTS